MERSPFVCRPLRRIASAGLLLVCLSCQRMGVGDNLPLTMLSDAINPPTYTISGDINGYVFHNLQLRNSVVRTQPLISDQFVDDLTFPNAVSSLLFPRPLRTGDQYSVSIIHYPDTSSQDCQVIGGTGVVQNSDIRISVSCNDAGRVNGTIASAGGGVDGLLGTGLYLTNNGGDGMTIAPGTSTYTFNRPVSFSPATTATVQVQSQPTSPWQTCLFQSNGTNAETTGVVATDPVSVSALECTTNSYNVSVNFQNLIFSGLQLTYNGSGAGTYGPSVSAWLGQQKSGTAYSIGIGTQPAGENCVVFGGTGTIQGSDITATVNCTTTGYSIGGAINVPPKGSTTLQLKLTVNGVPVEVLDLASNPSGYSFTNGVNYNDNYQIDISRQPAYPTGACKFSNGTTQISGTVGTSAVTQNITCSNKYPVNVTVNGLGGTGSGDSVTVTLNPSGENESITRTTNGVFSFVNEPVDQSSYTITVTGGNPTAQLCAVTGSVPASGTISGAAVNLIVTCSNLGYTEISAGYDHVLAIRSDGTLWGWGSSSMGQLGQAGGTFLSPVQIGTANDWLHVAAGTNFSVGIRASGAGATSGYLYTWGSNGAGKLGTGSMVPASTSVPVQVDASNLWFRVAVGDQHVLAIKENFAGAGMGTLYAWGDNYNVALGLGGFYNSPSRPCTGFSSSSCPTPTQEVLGYTDWTQIAAGSYHSLAVRGGTIYSWGLCYRSNLSSCTQSNYYSTPAVVGGGPGSVVLVVAGDSTSGAMTSAGILYMWGQNTQGQIGNGTTSDQGVPVAISGLWKTAPGSVALGRDFSSNQGIAVHTLAISQGGALYAWGDNSHGQQGRGVAGGAFLAPTIVGASTDWLFVSANRFYSTALRGSTLPGLAWAWGGYTGMLPTLGNGDTNWAEQYGPAPVQ